MLASMKVHASSSWSCGFQVPGDNVGVLFGVFSVESDSVATNWTVPVEEPAQESERTLGGLMFTCR